MNADQPPGEEGAAAPGDRPTIERLERSFVRETVRARLDLQRSGILLTSPAPPARRSTAALPLGIGVLAVILVVATVVLRGGNQLGNGGISPIDTGARDTPSPRPPATALATGGGQTAAPALGEGSANWNAITWSLTDPVPWRAAGNVFVQAATAWGDGFVAAGYAFGNAAQGAVWITRDGQTWQREPDPSGVFRGARLSGLAVSGGRLVLLGNTGVDPGSGPFEIWTSDDGVTWENAPDATRAFAGQVIQGITSGPGGFLAYAVDTEHSLIAAWVSSDGRAWEPGKSLAPPDAGLIVGSPHAYFASAAGIEWRSPDGRAWTRVDGKGSDTLSDFMPGAEGVVAEVQPVSTCPSGNDCFGPLIFPVYRQSFDGINWVDLRGVGPFTGQNGTLGGRMTSDGTTIVWVAPSGRIWTSLDGWTWHELKSFMADQASLQAVDQLSFGTVVVGARGLASIDQDADSPVVWYGAASELAPQAPQPTFPLRYQDRDAQCIGGEGGDPGVVCIQIGYYLRNDSGSDQLVRMQGAVNSVVRVSAGQTGYLTRLGPVWDSSLPLTVQLLNTQCDVVDELTATGNLELFTIRAGDSDLLTGATPPPAILPLTPFPTVTACGG